MFFYHEYAHVCTKKILTVAFWSCKIRRGPHNPGAVMVVW